MAHPAATCRRSRPRQRAQAGEASTHLLCVEAEADQLDAGCRPAAGRRHSDADRAAGLIGRNVGDPSAAHQAPATPLVERQQRGAPRVIGELRNAMLARRRASLAFVDRAVLDELDGIVRRDVYEAIGQLLAGAPRPRPPDHALRR